MLPNSYNSIQYSSHGLAPAWHSCQVDRINDKQKFTLRLALWIIDKQRFTLHLALWIWINGKQWPTCTWPAAHDSWLKCDLPHPNPHFKNDLVSNLTWWGIWININSIQYYSFVCTQRSGYKYCYLTLIILFNITHLFAYSKMIPSITMYH